MKTLMVYASKYGCTQKCAEWLKAQLGGNTTIMSANSKEIALAQYDTVVVGGSIYMAKIGPEIRRFCKKYEKQLLQKRLGLFTCCYCVDKPLSFFETHLQKHWCSMRAALQVWVEKWIILR